MNVHLLSCCLHLRTSATGKLPTVSTSTTEAHRKHGPVCRLHVARFDQSWRHGAGVRTVTDAALLANLCNRACRERRLQSRLVHSAWVSPLARSHARMKSGGAAMDRRARGMGPCSGMDGCMLLTAAMQAAALGPAPASCCQCVTGRSSQPGGAWTRPARWICRSTPGRCKQQQNPSRGAGKRATQ